ncbi:folate family ECF transporter S component [Lapidilactobacillus gannanensis]|jgi:ECF transporter S component (folate family)|uniref:Folate family ECF transporter S component n=1 Tax=Lapidilactobacillus gannanensis TaxID=2486002 RepID=A0ABW4BNN9_9LACO|nr:folate family ECF transporter S component [Lapidilactobacillus gannanensis]MCH4056526.1 folate family ECF transporter S component [Lactobacillaceae bacterium]
MQKTTRRGLATRKLVFLAVLIAMQLVVGRFSFGTNFLKVSATFLVSALIGYWYGPFYAAIAGGVSDLIGAILLPMGSFNFGFTLVAIFSGFIFGWLLDQRHMPQPVWWRVLAVAGIINLGSNLFLNTVLLHYMYGANFWPLFLTRLPKELIMIPIYYLGIYFLLKAVAKLHLEQRLNA